MGRWQTRLLLLGTVGLFVTLIFARFTDYDDVTLLALLGYVLVIGLVWDIVYNYLQFFRWDQDWPPLFQLISGIVEALLIWLLIVVWKSGGSHLPGVVPELTFTMFLAHYSAVWFTTFLSTQGLLRIIFPRWRYHGGMWM
jgi:uncharacterized membrane-anchored protein